jgi:hypothetical protein
VVSIAVVYIAAALRLKAPLSTELVLGAGVVGGLVWSVGLHAVAAPGLWIAGCGLVILALGLGTDSEAHASWKEWGPALAFTMIPANSAALKGGSLSAAVFDVAIATFVLLSAARLTQVVSDQGRWVVAVIIGVALIANGIWRETRRAGHERDASATSWYRSLT